MKYKLDEILVFKNKQVPIKKQIIKRERQPFKVKSFLAQRKVMYGVAVITLMLSALLTNSIVNYVFGVMRNIKHTDHLFSSIDFVFTHHVRDAQHIISLIFKPNHHLMVWLILFGLLSMLCFKSIHGFYKKHRKLDYGQKGDSHFETLKELKKQYPSVPQQVKEYKGQPGFPVTHFNDLPKILKLPLINKIFYNGKFLIDPDTVNVMVIGTSRSGKGESSVFPATDIDTRASEKPSLVFNDPKGELYAGSYETLRKRGYDVEVLNLVNPDEGMSYNMLQIIKDEYIKGDFAQAEQFCVSLTQTLFPTPEGGDPFWNNAASNLVNALIFAVIHRALEENKPERITMRNVVDLLRTLGPATEDYEDDDGNIINKLDEYITSLPADSIARKQYASSNFATGNTRGGILTVASATLNIFTSEKLSKMGSANSVDFTRVGFNKRMRVKFDRKYMYKRGVIHYGYGENDCLTNNFKVDGLGFMENNFKRSMKKGEIIRIEIEGDVFEYVFYREKPRTGFAGTNKKNIDPYTKERIYPPEAYLKQKSEKQGILSTTLFYSERPVAVFMVIPDYDTSIHVVAAVFISQLYTMLARRASESGGKCHQRVKFRLDEFGNLPPIHDMANILTVCLGRNILFELYVQGYSQVFSLYGDKDGNTIKDNCQIHDYIKSTNKETNDEISAKCGMKTVTSTSRSRSSGFNAEINETDTVEQVPIIEPDLLPKFVRGETVILRFLKNTDTSFNSVRPNPIYNTNETKMPFRFEYLSADFEPANQFADFDIPSLHREIKLSDYSIDWNSKPQKMEVVEKGLLAALDMNRGQKEDFEKLCNRLVPNSQLYEKIMIAQTKDHVTSNISQYLMNLSMSQNEIQDITEQIIMKINEIENGGNKNPFSTSNTIETEEESIYISTEYFSEMKVTAVINMLKSALEENEVEELLMMDKETFRKRMKELNKSQQLIVIENMRLNKEEVA